MYGFFCHLGEIHEVIITSKRDIIGHHYGFVRFFEVHDESLLVIKFDNLFIRNKKLHANLPIL